jgi:phosphoglycerate kinase
MSINYLKPNTLKNKTVLLRVDVNVPIDGKTGKIADDFRISSIIKTIKVLQQGKNRIILCGHLGRPEGRDKKFTLRPVAEKLAELMGYKFLATHHPLPDYPINHVIFYTGNIEADAHTEQLKRFDPKDIIFLENIRFYKGEEENDPHLAKKLSELADVYVNDAFSVDHHAAASVSMIPKYLPAYAGPELEQEVKHLSVLLGKVPSPFVVMMGGIKISDKTETLEFLGKRADKILLGGGLATLFFLSKGFEVGISKVEKEALKTAFQLEKNYKGKIILPLDLVVANKDMDKDSIRVCVPYEVRKDEQILDVGPKTILAFSQELKEAKTIVWNGPLGHFEVKPFDTATMALARVIGGVGKRKAYTVVGGGETVDAVRLCHQSAHIDHVSTGGGAMLEFLAGKKLPGIEALK